MLRIRCVHRSDAGAGYVQWTDTQSSRIPRCVTSTTPSARYGRRPVSMTTLRTDHKTTPMWAWPRSRDLISKFLDPVNFWTNWGIRVKFGTLIEDGPRQRAQYKSNPKWAWPGACDPISKFWDLLITFEGEKSYLLEIWYRHRGRSLPAKGSQTTPKWAWPGSRDLISKFWAPVNNFWTNWEIRVKIGTPMQNGPRQRKEFKATPKWAWPGARDPISKFWDPVITFEGRELSAWNLVET